MVLRLTSACVVLIFLNSGCARNTRQATLQNAIEYTSQFVSQQQDTSRQPIVDPVETGQLEDDPFVRSLFKEFLVQYQQLASEKKTGGPLTTTTTEKPFKPDFSTYTFPLIHSTPVPETTPYHQKRRLSSRRKINTPTPEKLSFNNIGRTTPFPTLLGRVNSLHDNSIESTTTVPVRHRFFGVAQSRPQKNPFTEQKPSPFVLVTTSTPQIVTENLLFTTQPPKSVPNVKIPQRLVNSPSNPFLSFSKAESTTKTAVQQEFDEEEFKSQAENAKYEFASDIDDEISGNVHQREEVRDGLAVKGRYSYSDGYFKRTVQYEADDKGYRVVKEDVEPLAGPQVNPDGQARVSSYVDGNTVNYQITKEDILKRNQKTIFHSPQEEIVVERN